MNTDLVLGYLGRVADEAQGEARTTLQEMIVHIRKMDSDNVFLKHRHLSLLLAIDKQLGVSARCDWDGKWVLSD